MNPAEYEKMFRVEDTHWWFAGKRRLVRVLLDSLPAQPVARSILDVGCGTGGMAALLKAYGCVYGVDASELAIGFSARRGIATLERAALPYLPFASGVFDVADRAAEPRISARRRPRPPARLRLRRFPPPGRDGHGTG